jgi:hypothetical protein
MVWWQLPLFFLQFFVFQYIHIHSHIHTGGHVEMSSILADQQSPPLVRAQILGVAGSHSQPMSTAVHAHGAQINFGYLTPYLTYAFIQYNHPSTVAKSYLSI